MDEDRHPDRRRESGIAQPTERVDEALDCLLAGGACLIACRGQTPAEWTVWLEEMLRPICTRISVFADKPGWRRVGVDLTKDPDRSEGAGASPLHVDFVNAENPPDYVVLVCAQLDPLGGGQSILSSLTEAVSDLPGSDRAQLAGRHFVDGKVENLLSVGGDMNPFAIVDSAGGLRLRYTAQLLKHTYAAPVAEALRHLQSQLEARQFSFMVPRGAALVIDQHRLVHGKMPLGPDQARVPADKRRVLLHGFFRSVRRESIDAEHH